MVPGSVMFYLRFNKLNAGQLRKSVGTVKKIISSGQVRNKFLKSPYLIHIIHSIKIKEHICGFQTVSQE